MYMMQCNSQVVTKYRIIFNVYLIWTKSTFCCETPKFIALNMTLFKITYSPFNVYIHLHFSMAFQPFVELDFFVFIIIDASFHDPLITAASLRKPR